MQATSTTDGKRPVTALAGPYGHPFHPILVTVPIGAWVASLVSDVIARAGDEQAVFAKGAYWLVGVGIVGALAASVFGFLDLFAIPTGTRASKTALTHMALNLTVVVLFAIGFFVRRGEFGGDGAPYICGGVVGNRVGAAGALGMAGREADDRYGVRVADDATQADGLQR